MSKQIKLWWCLFSIILNHSITKVEFFYWLNLDVLVILLLILSRISLLILPISDLVGLISWQVGLLVKFGLWSFSVMIASLLAVVSTLSTIPSFIAIFCFLCRCLVWYLDLPFCRNFVMFCSSGSLYFDGSSFLKVRFISGDE